MGAFIDGTWHPQDHFPTDARGAFERAASQFRGRLTLGEGEFPWERGRYVLYVGHACPWCHRTTIARSLYGLQDALPLSVVDPLMTSDGWHFSDGPGCIPDPLYGLEFARELYSRADPHYTGRVTVPVLWDSQRHTIVNNESTEIIRMLRDVARHEGSAALDLAPPELVEASDRWIAANYDTVNNGVYRCGFARSQEAYEQAFGEVFGQLDRLEQHLAKSRFLCGDHLTEADICLFVTLLRFDPVYVGHFKCNRHRIADLPNLLGFTRDVFQQPGVAETCHLDHIKQHYYRSHTSINPSGVVPVGPALSLEEPAGRESLRG